MTQTAAIEPIRSLTMPDQNLDPLISAPTLASITPPPGYGGQNIPPRSISGSVASSMLTEAAGIVAGARNVTHGDKERSFTAIAAIWDAYLRKVRKDPAAPIRAQDVAAMMVLMKLSRSEQGRFVRDHAVDAAGYAAIWGEIQGEGEKA